jgi:hypothetical protein
VRRALVALAFVLALFAWWFNTGCDDDDGCPRPPADGGVECRKATDGAP